MYLEGGDSGANLMVASTPSTFAAYISNLKVDPKKAAARDTESHLRSVVGDGAATSARQA